MKLSIIVPVYNEEKTLEKIIERVQKVDLGKISKEILIINDGSKDNTQEVIEKIKKKYKNIRSFSLERNQGKGAAMKIGFQNFTGDFVIIQDGDLEYDPEYFKQLIQPLIEGKTKVIYGSRLLGEISGFNIPLHYYGNKFLSLFTRLVYRQKITDLETGYKMMAREVIKSFDLKSNGFEIDPEMTAKTIKKGYKITEIPITYNCRTFEEGKKITWRDGIIAAYTLLKYRFFN